MSSLTIEEDTPDVERLVTDYQEGNNQAFNQLVNVAHEFSSLFNVPYANGFNARYHSQDVANSGFLLGLEKAARAWSPTDGSFLTYASDIVFETMRQETMLESGRTRSPEEWTMRSLDQDLGDFDLLDTLGIKDKSPLAEPDIIRLDGLNPLERNVLDLACNEGMCPHEISKRLGLDIRDVRDSIKRLNLKFSGKLGREDYVGSKDKLEKAINKWHEDLSLPTNQSNRFKPIPTEKLRDSYLAFLSGKRVYNPIQVYDRHSRVIIGEVLRTIDPEKEKSLKKAFQDRGFRRLLRGTGIREILKDLDPDRLARHPMPKYCFGEESDALIQRQYKRFLEQVIEGYAEADRLNSRDLKVKLVANYLRKEKRLSIKLEEAGFIGALSRFDRYSVKSFMLNCDKFSGDNLFCRSERFYVPTWLIRERGMWERGEESLKLAAVALEDVLFDYDGTSPEFRGYRHAVETGNRRVMTRILKDFFRSEPRVLEYLKKRGLGKVLDVIPEVNPDLKSNSNKALFILYDGQMGLGLFDRSQEHYVPHWLIRERDQWSKGMESVRLGIEAIQDVLFEVRGYREAEKTGNKSLQLKVLDIELFRKNPRLGSWLEDKGLGGVMDYLIDKKGKKGLRVIRSPIELLRFYDNNQGFGWFDESTYPVLKTNEQKRIYVGYDTSTQAPRRKYKPREKPECKLIA